MEEAFSMVREGLGHGVMYIVLSASLSLALLRLLMPLARRLGLLDHPHGRKDHAEPTASIGGLAMSGATGLMLIWFAPRAPDIDYFMLAAGMVVLIGALDDRYDLKWWMRILAQCAAVLVMVYCGKVVVQNVSGLFGVTSTGLGILSVPFTMFATVGIINAVNMSDGVDGLAGGVTLASLCMLEAAAIYSGNISLARPILFIIGAVIGFLMMNMRFPWQHRARVFMGDAGSAFLGFSIAWISFRLTQNVGHPVTPILPPWLVATPLIDCLSLIARRLMHRQSPFKADRDHMHHLMLDAGFKPAQVTLSLMATNIILGLAASLALLAKVPQPVLVLAFVALCLGYFWLTARRARALAVFGRLHAVLSRLLYWGPTRADRARARAGE